MVLGKVFVEDAEGANHPRVGIRKQGVRDATPFCKLSQQRLTVITQSGNSESKPLEFLLLLFQLDQLGLAEGSPIRRADEQEDKALRSAERFEGLSPAEVVTDCEQWDSAADRRS